MKVFDLIPIEVTELVCDKKYVFFELLLVLA